MQTHLAAWIRDTPEGRDADRILRSCVHCGFCNATCPTYQLLGDELDGPRGRIYQIKDVLEGAPATRATQLHLDRCLTCLGCETTCPSGVEYGHLLEIGRAVVDAQVERPALERLLRHLVREGISRRAVFRWTVRLGRWLRPLLPARLGAKLPRVRAGGPLPSAPRARRVLFLTSCAQDALSPAIDCAARRVLDRLGVAVVVAQAGGCCGALQAHLSDAEGARAAARRNVDAWSPLLEQGAVALVMTASGCGVQVKDYGRLLAAEPAYAARAARVSALTLDLSQWLTREGAALDALLVNRARIAVAYHAPCTLRHGQRLAGEVEAILRRAGAELVPVADAHLCCGSAGSYSLLHGALADALRRRKVEALLAGRPALILSANIGCLAHLEPATGVPVRHWIEWLDQRLSPQAIGD